MSTDKPERSEQPTMRDEYRKSLESQVCPDCTANAKHAYSDATTPGFFSPYCEKHKPKAAPTPAGEPEQMPREHKGPPERDAFLAAWSTALTVYDRQVIHLRQQVATLTAERDSLQSQIERVREEERERLARKIEKLMQHSPKYDRELILAALRDLGGEK